ncbi:hypothetical protein BRC2024_KWYBBTRE_CDS_0108 [Acinetobacter phage vB_AbaM_AB-Navy-v2]
MTHLQCKKIKNIWPWMFTSWAIVVIIDISNH